MQHFPKIWHLGHKNIFNLFDQDVEITEKIDGSQFVFGWDVDGKYHCRSKGVMIDPENPPNLFRSAVEWSSQLTGYAGHVFYGETLCKPRHNTLAYNKVPTNHFVLFGVSNFAGDDHIHDHSTLKHWATTLGCDVVPLMHKGKADFDLVEKLLGSESYLGGPNAEGVVVKAGIEYELYGQHVPIMCGKYVTEEFKEVHSKNPEFTSGKSKMQDLYTRYRTEARWDKAVQYLKETEQYYGEPKDIGNLMKRVNEDLEAECKEAIMDDLWSIYRKDVLKNATLGLPEWFKRKLATGE